MLHPINFEAKTDRELLLLVALQTNTLAEKMPQLEKRIIVIEDECKKRSETSDINCQPAVDKRKIMAAGAGISGGVLIVIYLILRAMLVKYGIVI